MDFLLLFSFLTVPVSPPSQYQADYSSEMLVRIIHDCGAAFVLTSKEFASHKSITELLKSSPVPWHCEVDTEILPEEASESEATMLLDKGKPEDIPFLLYTSGSTGTCMTDCVHIWYSICLHTSYQQNDDGHVCMHNCGIWLVDIQSGVVNRYNYMI